MHLNKIGEVNVVLQECIEIFKEQMEKEAKAGRDIILDEYRPAEGDYIIVKKDGSLMSCSIKEDKKKKTLEGINESDFLYRDICFYDYHSRLISMDKPQDSKKIVHSNNYMSFWVKYESFDNGKLDVQAIDRYFDVLINPREKYKNADRVMYDFIYQQIGDVDTQQLESNRKWIKENIFQLDKTELNLQKKKYLKIFFEDDRDTYIREEKRYVMTKIYNKNDYNIEINNNMYGLPNDNLGLNSKKPYLEHKTRKLPVPNLIDVKQVLLQRKFFDFLANKANAGLTNVFFENESREITAYPNGEFEKGDFSGYFLQIQKGKSVLIKYQDTIVDYRYNLQKNFILKKILNWTPNKNSTQSNNVYENYYDTYTDKNKIFTVLDDVLFFKCLKRNLFNDVEDIMVDNPCIKRNIIMSRDIIFAWIYKGQKNGVQNVIKNVGIDIIKNSINAGYMGKAVLQFNMLASFEEYFGGEDMKNKYSEIRSSIKTKINSNDYQVCESNDEYLYAVGQLIRYFVSLSKIKDKAHSLANPFLSCTDSKQLTKKLEHYFKKYNYNYKVSDKRSNKLYTLVSNYEYDKKIDTTMVIAGYISDNLVYESDKEGN